MNYQQESKPPGMENIKIYNLHNNKLNFSKIKM